LFIIIIIYLQYINKISTNKINEKRTYQLLVS